MCPKSIGHKSNFRLINLAFISPQRKNNWTLKYFFNWDSLHARLNSHYEAWSYIKKKHKKIEAYKGSFFKTWT